jgi:hypothetical protein
MASKRASRETKVEWLLNNIAVNGCKDKESLIYFFALHFGSTARTGREIVDMLESAGYIKIDEKGVRLCKKTKLN